MKNFLIAFTVFIIWSFFGLWLYSWFQTEEETIISKVKLAESVALDSSKTNAEKTTINTEKTNQQNNTDSLYLNKTFSEANEAEQHGLKAINNEGRIVFYFPEGISMMKNSSEIFIPEAIADYKYKIHSYLLENPDKEVHINSLYSASENIDSPNLGVKRGEKIRDELLSLGISKERIVVKPIIKEINFNTEGLYNNSISIIFKPLDYSRIEELKNKLPDSKIVYPGFSDSGITINQNLKDLLKEIKEVVRLNPEVRIELIGHTDNIGNATDNYKMALSYSKQVEWYLVAKGGIENSKIKSSSKGESEPIDTNNSERGRIANRRVEVVFY